METIVITVKPSRERTRVHKVLFQKDLPFKPRREALKTVYKRREKYQKAVDISSD